jgi:S-adenosylmethionine-diacylglycerol 3-amino-3-carboxypropyl transferase
MADTHDQKDQVDLFTLLFGSNWEDPDADRRALSIRPGETLLTVTSGGCNTLTLLLEDPGKIYTVDINPTQTWLLELKIAAIRTLSPDALRAFLGLTQSTTRAQTRVQTYTTLRPSLTPAAAAYWDSKPEAIRKGVIHAGNYENFVRLFSRLVKLLQGKKRIAGLFACTTLDQQKAYFDSTWNTLQWRLIFKVLVSKTVLARRGLTADYFKFDDGSASFSESFFKRARRAICDIPIQSNYFLAQYLMGHYRSPRDIPAYLLDENLATVKSRLDRIEIVTAPAQAWLASLPPATIDAFALSNICELMSLDETARLFAEVARTATPGARVCFRNLMIPRAVPESLEDIIELDAPLSRDLLATDRSFVYSRVHAYTVNP